MSGLFWIIGGGGLGLAISFVFSDLLKLSRRMFLIPYITFLAVFLTLFFSGNVPDARIFLTHNPVLGVILGIGMASLHVKKVFSQPRSRTVKGRKFLFDLGVTGIIYGMIDGLYLNVMPVLAIIKLAETMESGNDFASMLAVKSVALAASLFVTFLYHFGYAEFRNKSMFLVLLGNAMITLTYIISGNPVAAVFCHAAMHVAAVIQGPETTLQLPPHRKK